MELITVDLEKCKKDGICVEVCPAGVLEMKEAGPALVEGAEEYCIRCGHCVSVCPHGAFSHAAIPLSECISIQDNLIPEDKQIEHFLKSRRSIRAYKNATVDKDKILRLIDIARYAPSGHNHQPVNWTIIYEPGDVRRLAGVVADWMKETIVKQPEFARAMNMDQVVKQWEKGNDKICRGAPHVVIAHAAKDDRTAPTACTIALTYLELAAYGMGLGACWAGYFYASTLMWPPMQKALDLPEGQIVHGAMMLGYPKYKYFRQPLRNPPKINWQ